jgi:hypothetical protein
MARKRTIDEVVSVSSKITGQKVNVKERSKIAGEEAGFKYFR